jgi:hypothetical protein
MIVSHFWLSLLKVSREGSKASDSINGEHIYRVGSGTDAVKSGLPTRVKLRPVRASDSAKT